MRTKPLTEFFSTELGENLTTGESLASHAHFRIGGPADYFYTARTLSGLVFSVQTAWKNKYPVFIMGGGFNLLFDDRGYRGMVVKNAASGVTRITQEKYQVLSGTSLPDLIRFCIQEGLAGAEFLAGIPGTLGGAVAGNAGAFSRSISELISEAEILEKNGSTRKVDRDYFQFGYRESLLKRTGEWVLKANLNLKKQDCGRVQNEVKRLLQARKGKHPPWGTACAGSFFKNPVLQNGKKVAAGYLLDQAGAKKLKVGDAEVYRKHANFIINRGHATCRDVQMLAGKMKQRVKNKFKINLEEEVRYLPANP